MSTNVTDGPIAAACGVTSSMSGQAWRWRSPAAGMPADAADDLLSQILLTRGAEPDRLADYARPSLRAFMPDPSAFNDMDRAVDRIIAGVRAQESIVIYGDYDVDGATSAALLVRVLRAIGVDAQTYIPDRLLEGYGPSADALVALKGAGADLVITVDCGAQAFEAIGAARDAGLDVVVVDHHQCTTTLPAAFALVNPNRLDEGEIGRRHGHLAAVGMAFLLAAGLVRRLRAMDWFADRPEPDLMALLDLVALGTVADVAKLQGLNRAFVAQGLKVMARRNNIGMAALTDVAQLKRAPLAHDLGFALGPRINAGGRVGQSDLGVRLLTTDDPAEAREIAAILDQHNQERRAIEAAVTEQALAMVDHSSNAAVCVVAGQGWHPGVIGIVASRVKERTGCPSVVIATDDNGVGKGSGRSIDGVDLGAAVIAARDAGLLIAGGGHAMAAGLTISADGVGRFADWLNERLAGAVAAAQGTRSLALDALLAPGGVTADYADALDVGGPYGHGWPQPRVAVGPVRLVRVDTVGTGHVRMIAAGDDGRSFKAITFRAADSVLGQTLLGLRGNVRIWLAGRIKRDDWSGRGAAEMHVDDAALAD